MSFITVQTPDLRELRTLLRKFSDIEGNLRMKFGFEQFLNYIADAARLKVPVKNGTLQASVTYEIEQKPGKLIGVVGSNVEYAPYVELGTGIYGPRKRPIRPKHSKILAWVSRGPRPTSAIGWKRAVDEGRAVFAKEIKGMKPRPFLLPAINENIDKITNFLKDSFTNG